MKKRGVSPLISWILLVGMTVSIGSMVYFWATNFARNVNIDNTDNSIYCDNVALKLVSSCRDGSRLNINVTNSGSYNITTMTFTRTTELLPTASCIIFNEPPLAPGKMFNYSFDLSSDIPNVTEIGICPTSPRVDLDANLLDFNIIPWITIRNDESSKDIACSDRKLPISYTDMNSLCSGLITSFSLSNVNFSTFLTCSGSYDINFDVKNNAAVAYTTSPIISISNGNATATITNPSPMSIQPGQTQSFSANIANFVPNSVDSIIIVSISVVGDAQTSQGFVCS